MAPCIIYVHVSFSLIYSSFVKINVTMNQQAFLVQVPIHNITENIEIITIAVLHATYSTFFLEWYVDSI